MYAVWQILMQVENGMKQLAWHEYNGVEGKIKEARANLTIIQQQMRDHDKFTELRSSEVEAKNKLEKWLLVEESIMHQKSRVQWLEIGDTNTAYFHACLKIGKHKIISGS